MKKLTFNAIAFYISILSAFSQNSVPDSSYSSRRLKIAEVNLVSAYYSQNGNHSAVTGGIGTEKLTDISNTIDLKLTRSDKKNREHNINLEVGVDHYTSASSDKIDPSTVSSASYSDTRFYPSLGYSVTNPKSGTTVGVTGSFSSEYDYTSGGLALNFAKASKDNNRELSLKVQAFMDQWLVILPIELRHSREDDNYSPRNSYSASLTYSQVVNQRFQFMLLADLVTQKGLLGTSYQRVYFNNNSETYEQLPDKRLKIPLGIKANYFLSDRVIFRSFYRYYKDDWGIKAQTAELEIPVKINPFFSVSPFYRFYSQNAADYFAPYKAHSVSEKYFTSDYDLSQFKSQFIGAGFRFTPANGLFGMEHWSMLEIRYGHYKRTNDLTSNIVSLNLKFK
ncbi:MAG: DUF3570 domain-containing protein [Chitinophagaceae bacterium]